MFELKGEPVQGKDGHDLSRYVQVPQPVVCGRCHRKGGTLVKRETRGEKEYLHPGCIR